MHNNIWIFLKKSVYVRIMIDSMLSCVFSEKLWQNPITIVTCVLPVKVTEIQKNVMNYTYLHGNEIL